MLNSVWIFNDFRRDLKYEYYQGEHVKQDKIVRTRSTHRIDTKCIRLFSRIIWKEWVTSSYVDGRIILKWIFNIKM
jgi:hypothetical protein